MMVSGRAGERFMTPKSSGMRASMPVMALPAPPAALRGRLSGCSDRISARSTPTPPIR